MGLSSVVSKALPFLFIPSPVQGLVSFLGLSINSEATQEGFEIFAWFGKVP